MSVSLRDAAASCALLALAASPAIAQPAAPPPGCTSPESRQFDFWVGRWTVSPYGHPEKTVASSLIERLYGGCAIRENWSPTGGTGGGSLSSWVPGEGAWRQTWVDSAGSRVDFKGGWDGHAMVLTGVWPQPGHPSQLTRMTYTREDGGAVRQRGETSDDGGKTWAPGFDLLYRPAN
ncbi:MAG TPA: hypothetical protein VG939_10305 [Caulobacteraceae bacterium]|nr:hypothetical protein [Caulobacteraceae bacterium]